MYKAPDTEGRQKMLWTAKVKEEPVLTSWEPVELTALKRKLATLSCHFCNCITARKATIANTNTPLSIDKSATSKAVSFEVNPNDKDTQVGQNACSFDRYTQSCEEDILKDQNPNFQHKDMCPSCFVTMNLLRAGKLFRVLKDEESETKAEMNDKCTEKQIESIEKATSFSTNPYDNNDLGQVVNYSDTSLMDGKRPPHVKFWDVKINTDINAMLSPPCVCVDELIDSIRPSPFRDMGFRYNDTHDSRC